jgi:hypothetical protein
VVAVLGMTERQIFVHDVVVPAPFAAPRQVAGSFEIIDEVPRRGSSGKMT